jgi:Flagellar biosynthesis protein, FliO
MTLKNRKHRLPLVGQSQPIFSLEPEPAPPKGSFHAVLSELSEGRVEQPLKRSKFALPFSLRESEPGRPRFSVLGHAWSWVHTKYALTATKRMRVVETLPLGEKRFVALVRVEDREFLVGGGTSGVSLLAQLETVPDPVDALQRKSGMAGDPE